MKFCLIFAVVLVVVSAEPPRYRTYLQRQEQEVESAPYAPAGFRPAGPQFNLPARQTQQVEELIPRTIYGPPTEETPTTTTDITTTDYPTTTLEPRSSQLNEEKVAKPEEEDPEKPEDVEAKNLNDEEVEELENHPTQMQPKQEGVYYILLSNGQLQKVQYLTTVNDVRNMAYSTNLRYENVQPISGPIYAFTPEQQLVQVIF